jgi:hypothetical protein
MDVGFWVVLLQTRRRRSGNYDFVQQVIAIA